MRIIAGKLKGANLHMLKDKDTYDLDHKNYKNVMIFDCDSW